MVRLVLFFFCKLQKFFEPMKKTILSVLLVSISILSFSKNQPKAVKGVLDLTGWNFQKDGTVSLIGEWEFYWDKIIQPEHFHLVQQVVTGYIKMPSYWKDQVINGQKFPIEGCATYRLIVKTKHCEDEEFSAHLKEMFSSYKLFVNGKLVAKNGKVSETKNGFSPEYFPQTVPLYFNTTENEIVLQIANFSHIRGGQLNEIVIGSYKEINQRRTKGIALDLFMFGSFFIIALYHFTLFALRRKDKSTLFFGLYTLAIAIRTISTGEQFHSVLFPSIPWEICYKFDFLSLFVAPPLLATFFFYMFPKESWRIFVWIFNILSTILAIATIILPIRIISQFEDPYQILMFVAMLYSLIVLVRSVIHKREGALIVLIGIVIVFATVINDILYYHTIIQSEELIPYGMMIFIFSQAYVVSMRFSKSFVRTEELTEELNYQNKNLEKIVNIRTQEISQQKEEILSQSDLLEKANIDLELKSQMVTDSITYAKDIQEAIFPSSFILKKHFPEHFLFFRPRDIVSGDFYWFFTNKKKRFIAAIDCTGHGVPGAFMSMIGNTLLNSIVKEQKVMDPAEILTKLNKEVIYSFKQSEQAQDDGMDVTLCCIDDENKSLTIAMANHKAIVVINDTFQVLEGSIYSIGGALSHSSDVHFMNHVIPLESDILLYMFSDGIIDQFSDFDDKKFGFDQLQKLIKMHSKKAICDQYHEIVKAFDAWKGTKPQTDDVLLIGMKLSHH